MKQEETPTIEMAPEAIKFTPKDGFHQITGHWYKGDDGYEYMVWMTPRETECPGYDKSLEENGWCFLETLINRVQHAVRGEKHVRKYPGPVKVELWRRKMAGTKTPEVGEIAGKTSGAKSDDETTD